MKFLFLASALVLVNCVAAWADVSGVPNFIDGEENSKTYYSAGDSAWVIVADSDEDGSTTVQDTLTVWLSSTTETEPESLTLVETGPSTGIFKGWIFLDSNSASYIDNRLQVLPGDLLYARYDDSIGDHGNPESVFDTAYFEITPVTGTLPGKTTWTKALGPYLITGDVSVYTGDTLVIEPGVRVCFKAESDDQSTGDNPDRSELRIMGGHLEAIGDSLDPIFFTSNRESAQTGDWETIRLSDDATGVIEYAYIQHAKTGITVYSATSAFIKHVRIEAVMTAITISDVYSPKFCMVDSNWIVRPGGNGIAVYGGDSLTISRNIIDTSGYAGIYLTGGSIDSNVIVMENELRNDFKEWGIYAGDNSRPAIIRNLVENFSVGIRCDMPTSTYPTAQNVSENFIFGGGTGIRVSAWASPRVWNNSIYGQSDFQLYNESVRDVDARFNYWGEGATDSMNTGNNPKNITGIYDYYDDASFGRVDYDGWLSGTSLNATPVITSTPDSVAWVSMPYTYQITAMDAENDPLTFGLNAFPIGMIIDTVSGLVSWMPMDTGSFFVETRVMDSSGNSSTQGFTLTVAGDTVAPDNGVTLTATPLNAQSVLLAWNPSVIEAGDADSIGIWWDTHGYLDSVNGTATAGAERYPMSVSQDTISGLLSDTTYFFSLFVSDSNGNWSDWASTARDSVRLVAPGALILAEGEANSSMGGQVLNLMDTIPVMHFLLTRDTTEFISIDSIGVKLTRGDAGQFTELLLIHDVNYDLTPDPEDAFLDNMPVDSASRSTVFQGAPLLTIGPGITHSYFIYAVISGVSISVGDTAQFELNDYNIAAKGLSSSADLMPAGGPVVSPLLTGAQGELFLNAGFNNGNLGRDIFSGEDSIAVFHLELYSGMAEHIALDNVKLKLTNGSPEKISQMLLVKDGDNNGFWDGLTVDPVISTASVPHSDSIIAFQLSGTDTLKVSDTAGYFILMNLDSIPLSSESYSFELDNTGIMGIGVQSGSTITANGPLLVSMNFPAAKGRLLLEKGPGNDVLGGAAFPGDTLPVMHMLLSADSLEDLNLDTVAIRLFQGNPANIAEVMLIRDVNGSGLPDSGDGFVGISFVDADSMVRFANLTQPLIPALDFSHFFVLTVFNSTPMGPGDVYQFDADPAWLFAQGARSLGPVPTQGDYFHSSTVMSRVNNLHLAAGANNPNLAATVRGGQDSIPTMHVVLEAGGSEDITLNGLRVRLQIGKPELIENLVLVNDANSNGIWDPNTDVALGDAVFDSLDLAFRFDALPHFLLPQNMPRSLLLLMNLGSNILHNGEGFQFILNSLDIEARGRVSLQPPHMAGGSVLSPILRGTDDYAPPIVSVAYVVTTNRSPTLTGGIDDPAAVVSVIVNDQSYTAYNNGNGTWILPDNRLVLLADGVYDVVVLATDPIGNTFADSGKGALTIDATPPAITFLDPAHTTTIDAQHRLKMAFDEPVFPSAGMILVRRTRDSSVFDVIRKNSAGIEGFGSDTLVLKSRFSFETAEKYFIQIDSNALRDKAGNFFPGLSDVHGWGFSIAGHTVGAAGDTVFGPGGVRMRIFPDALDEPVSITIRLLPNMPICQNNTENSCGFTPAGPLVEFLPHGLNFKQPARLSLPFVQTAFTGQQHRLKLFWSASPNGPWEPLSSLADTTSQTVKAGITHFSYGVVGFDGQSPKVGIKRVVTANRSPLLRGTVDDSAAAVKIEVAGRRHDAVNLKNGFWQLDSGSLKALPDGNYDIVAMAVDARGNTGWDTTRYELFIDGTPPRIGVSPLIANTTRPFLSGHIDDPTADIFITLENVTRRAVNNGNGTWTLSGDSLPALSEGRYTVKAVAVDSLGNTGHDSTSGELVLAFNDPPRFEALPETLIALEDTRLDFPIRAADPDSGDSLHFSLQVLDGATPWLSLKEARLTGVPLNGDVGAHKLKIEVSDGKLSHTAELLLIVKNVNDAPQIRRLPDTLIAVEDSLFHFRPEVFDEDIGDSIHVSLIPNGWLTVLQGTLKGKPANSHVGSSRIAVVAWDGELSDTAFTTLTVLNVNDAPLLTGLVGLDSLNQQWKEDRSDSFTVEIHDPDKGDEPVFDSTGLPDFIRMTGVSGTDARTFGFRVFPLQNDTGRHTIKLRFTDLNESELAITARVFVEETNDMPVAKVLSHTLAGGALRALLGVEDEDGSLAETRFHYSVIGGSGDTLLSGNIKDPQLDVFPLLDGSYRLLMHAEDRHGLRQDEATALPFNIADVSAFTLDSGVWSMAGSPRARINASALGDGVFFCRWNDKAARDPLFDRYISQSQLTAMERGGGYWLLPNKTLTLKADAGDLLASDLKIRLVNGSLGWNQLSNPHPYPVDLSKSGLHFWRWNPDSADMEDAGGMLRPWEACWVRVPADTTLVIPAKPFFGGKSLAKLSHGFTSAINWTGRLILKSGRFTDKANLFGVRSLTKKAASNPAEPPKMGEHISLFFTGEKPGGETHKYAADLRRSFNPAGEWFQFGVTSKVPGIGQAQISLEGLSPLRQSGLYTFLVDKEKAHRLEEGVSMELQLAKKARYYSIVVTNDMDFENKLRMTFNLSQNIPNPVRYGTTFRFTLPYRFDSQGRRLTDPYPVSIHIYDLKGRRMTTVRRGKYHTGVHSLHWRKPVSMPSGGVVYRIEAGSHTASKKMMLLR